MSRLVKPPMVLVESGLNSEYASLMSPIYIENCILVFKQVVLIAKVALISSGRNNGSVQYRLIIQVPFLRPQRWSLQ